MPELQKMTEFLRRTGARSLAIGVLDHFAGMAASLDQFAELCESFYHVDEFGKSALWAERALSCADTPAKRDYLLSMLANARHRSGMHEEALSALDAMADSSCMEFVRAACLEGLEHRRHLSDTGFWGEALSSCHAHSRDLADWIAGFLDPKVRVNDLGCGDGFYLGRLSERGFTDLVGYEGDPMREAAFRPIRRQDITVPFDVDVAGSTIFLEVGEHVPRRFQDVVVDNVCRSCSDRLVMSWAMRDQLGVGHVNCLDPGEVVPMFESRGLELMERETAEARSSVRDGCGWFAHNLLVFQRPKR